MAHKVKIFCLHFRLFIICLLFFQFSQAQTNFSKLDNWLENSIADLGGRAVLLVWKDGKVVYENAVNELTRKQQFIGKRIARKTGREIDMSDFDANSKQRIASCSKWLTAALAMTFIDEKKMSLEDSIGKFLPVMTQHGKGNIKVWHCLSHLTGIKQIGVMDAMSNGNESRGGIRERMQQKENGGLLNKLGPWTSMQDAIDSIAKTDMEGEPGKTFHYGNAGLQIIAAICEVVGNNNFETLFQEKIAKPLKMKDTDFGYGKVPLAAGGAYSTPKDYLNFLQMMLNEGNFNGKQIISQQSIISMQKNYVSKDCNIVFTPAEASNWGYGFGTWTMDNATENNRSKGLTSPGMFGSFPWIENEKKYAAILFTLNLKNKGRGEKYRTLKQLVDEAIAN